ncbi:hypothetical protein NNL21_26630 [Paenibacillus mendelii]|nr:hypothetical protein [Paenibacillus mendelii]
MHIYIIAHWAIMHNGQVVTDLWREQRSRKGAIQQVGILNVLERSFFYAEQMCDSKPIIFHYSSYIYINVILKNRCTA